MVEPIPSATVILLYDIEERFELLLVKRNSELDFCGGAWVFPGGRIESRDYQLLDGQDELEAARFAAVRETREEIGLTIQANNLTYFDHLVTPVGYPKRFSTHFFFSQVESQLVTVDNQEIIDYQWLQPEKVLKKYDSGSIYLPIPTLYTIQKIGRYNDLKKLFLDFQ